MNYDECQEFKSCAEAERQLGITLRWKAKGSGGLLPRRWEGTDQEGQNLLAIVYDTGPDKWKYLGHK